MKKSSFQFAVAATGFIFQIYPELISAKNTTIAAKINYHPAKDAIIFMLLNLTT